jgi:PTS system N-acetylgalactosamine-specific IIA component
MSSGGPVRAMVAAHGELAAGLVSGVEAIAGRGSAFIAFSNRGLGPADIERAIRETVETGALEVVFTDLPMGSCAMAARRVQRQRPGLLVVTGVNLAVLLDFAMADGVPAREAAERAVARGKEALGAVGGPHAG